ncbi:MAG: DNA gyrase inhibitor YacG [Pirellulales bacterium]
MPQIACPTCQKKFDSDATKAMPFCSTRCKLIDLGKWLDEENSIPTDIEQSLEEGSFSEGTDWD